MPTDKLQSYAAELEVLVKEILLPIYNKHMDSRGHKQKNINELLTDNRKAQLPALLKPKVYK